MTIHSNDMKNHREMLRLTIKQAGDLSDADSEVIMQRIADRLGGYTHEEVVQMHPLSTDCICTECYGCDDGWCEGCTPDIDNAGHGRGCPKAKPWFPNLKGRETDND